jgi:adenine-specific DNA-methyltransferase
MILTKLKPKKALNKAFVKVKPVRSDIEKFKTNLIYLLDNINDKESEEFHKNLISEFLKKTYYDPNHFINTKGRNDLVIHNGNTAKSSVGVIIETKSPNNKGEMVSPDKINTKSFQELVLYYLRERITHKNIEVKHLIITNIHEWYIFDATQFDRLFAQNKKLVAQFTDFEAGRLSDNKTDFFYKQIAEPYIASLTQELEFAYFNIQDYQTALRNDDKADDNQLISLFKILSPEHLLKLPFVNDSNTLDKRFYNELLYIIGLAETKDGGKKLIGRYKDGERQTGSLIEDAIIQIDGLDKLERIPNRHIYGDNKQEQLYNIALELCITWINRILFLKLLEGQLISYHKGDKAYNFLNSEKIKNFDDLNTLFFQVLAKGYSERNDDVKKLFSNIPYLNSSLFEPTELEHNAIFISNLKDEKTLPIHSATVLKDDLGKKRKGSFSTLEYLFEFLDAYDFSSEGKEDIQEDNKTIINASVLGLIFEKINGYKDGSFFTPGFITMYMCRETIRKAVLQKFNETKQWNCTTIDELYEKIDDRKEANTIINSIKICDPAVGSGHFLVSALNEIIAIKSELKVLHDRQGKRLKEYHVEVVNDELIITDEDGEFFDYKPNNPESQRVQETLFHEKQTIIENCLFGVDINPNSVKICRLRLWIELLKNAYYKNATELETLPNIDINIKCGNSLVSRFAIDADLKEALKKNKTTIGNYRNAVATYRNAESKEQKREMEKLIESIKTNFRSEIALNDPKLKKLSKLKGEQINLTTQTTLFEKSKKEQATINKQITTLTQTIKKLETEIEEIKANKIYENAFEWRFEFPEVLNDDGDFVGFDVVIGNPPYIPLEAFELNERKFFNSKYAQLERKYETSVPFILEGLKILKTKGLLAYIAPVTCQTGENYTKFRSFFFQQFGLEKLINLPFNIFEDAYVDTALYFVSKEPKPEYLIFAFDKKAKVESLEKLEYNKFKVSEIKAPDFKIIIDKTAHQFSRFSSTNFVPLGSITKSTQGLSGSNFKEAKNIETEFLFPFLSRGNVYNFCLVKDSIFYTDLADKKNLIQFYQPEPKILIRRIINRQDRLSVTYCEEKLVFKKDINPFIPIDENFDCHFLTGIVASKLISFIYLNSSSIATKDDFRQTTLTELRKLPVPNIDINKQKPISDIVKEILNLKSKNIDSNTINLETQIDKLVYQLYELTEEEIKIVEGIN